MNEKITVWGIHNTSNEASLLQNKIIAIGWHKMGDLSQIKADRDSYYKAYNKIYPSRVCQVKCVIFFENLKIYIKSLANFSQRFYLISNKNKILSVYIINTN